MSTARFLAWSRPTLYLWHRYRLDDERGVDFARIRELLALTPAERVLIEGE